MCTMVRVCRAERINLDWIELDELLLLLEGGNMELVRIYFSNNDDGGGWFEQRDRQIYLVQTQLMIVAP